MYVSYRPRISAGSKNSRFVLTSERNQVELVFCNQFVGFRHTSPSCRRAQRWSTEGRSISRVSLSGHRCRTCAGGEAPSTYRRSPGNSTRRRRSARTSCSWPTSVRQPRTRASRRQSLAASNTTLRSASEVGKTNYDWLSWSRNTHI